MKVEVKYTARTQFAERDGNLEFEMEGRKNETESAKFKRARALAFERLPFEPGLAFEIKSIAIPMREGV